MTWLSELRRRASKTPEETRAENLRRWVSTIEGAVSIDQVVPRRRCKVGGVIQNIRIDPTDGSGTIEATIIDGTGQMVAKWLGRSSLSGVRLGMGLVMEGTVATGANNEPFILNPDYRLVAGPEHG